MLNQIVERKREELASVKESTSLSDLQRRCSGDTPAKLSEALGQDKIHIIAEIKYKSPSRGVFPCKLSPTEVAQSYVENGASAISVLTETHFFDGRLEYLEQVHQGQPSIPLLRKDFLFDRYQLLEARAYGASAALLIVACLEIVRLSELISYGVEIGLETLVEAHDPWELDKAIESGARIIGINNRDLKTMEVRLQTSFDLARRLEGTDRFILVSESGIHEKTQILELRDAGFSGFLIGTAFMDTAEPGAALASLLKPGQQEPKTD